MLTFSSSVADSAVVVVGYRACLACHVCICTDLCANLSQQLDFDALEEVGCLEMRPTQGAVSARPAQGVAGWGERCLAGAQFLRTSCPVCWSQLDYPGLVLSLSPSFAFGGLALPDEGFVLSALRLAAALGEPR